jgi:hypothetical protein
MIAKQKWKVRDGWMISIEELQGTLVEVKVESRVAAESLRPTREATIASRCVACRDGSQ